ncbi:type I-U CRISPR-associated helicase/endonuclease Cas3 [Schaalia sp. 19OD2882]|uniref:type I-G CRISPR-associated helicase/endonuclease Cas3g n=1 Tax=Schaalia sp. 19OD2882 TaxID=2794089 RepID=UPI001C1ED1A0|nr:type I-U CRISPR-associated helicase/endonuclease Cas3 [Schaalia sp. 19OD2882]QWW19374.1 type I-U CRISPR-associated helicase/endonuclease Cas3 [Schaalia sp. 19OD2882]
MKPVVAIDEFGDFFAAIHGGSRPFVWQEDLLREVSSTGMWPDQIAAPTGSGKSSVVEVHVFANALAACGTGARVPRRLAIVVNRRALTDAHADRVTRIQELLEEPVETDGILTRVRDALVSLRPQGAQNRQPLVSTVMRGAAAIDRRWLDAPEACAVLCMTPAMWASSLLFRSYGASEFARPRLAGLLALDAAVVIDEAHLSRQILVTAKRATELSQSGAELIGVPGLQVVEMTATPTGSPERPIGVTRSRLDADPRLRARVCASKAVTYAPTVTWPASGKLSKDYRDFIVGHVIAQVELAKQWAPDGSRTVGCIVNRVASAVALAAELRKKGLRCATWVGRMRPWDLKALRNSTPGLFTTEGSADIDVLVATQTVEVGVDLDLAALVTELASGSALAQRAGRVNRMGLRPRGPVVVVGPDTRTEIRKDLLPYRAADLRDARSWVCEHEASGSISPLSVCEAPPSPDERRRVLWQRPEPWDVALWSRTSQHLVVEPDLDLWLRDDLEPDVEGVGVVVRDLPKSLDSIGCETLLTEVPPIDDEVYPAEIGTLRTIVTKLAGADGAPLEHSVLWRTGAAVPHWQTCLIEGPDAAARVLQPGDILVLDSSVGFLTEGVAVDTGRELGVPVPFADHPSRPTVITDPDELESFIGLDAGEIQERLGGIVNLPPAWDDACGPAWIVLRQDECVESDTDEASSISRHTAVPLDEHNTDVARRASELAGAIGMDASCAALLGKAGLWHDVGKEDHRFQRLLGQHDRAVLTPLAKSGMRSRREMWHALMGSGLPSGWRHELVSAAAYWVKDRDPLASEDRDLVTRLIGTSHGRGRPIFDHDPQTAGPMYMAALNELVGEGEWESLIARTDRRWGHWGVAYLEAVLRAADCTISSEGK